MPYVRRTVVAGSVRETKKMYTPRYGGKGKRGLTVSDTGEAQEKVNERKAEERLRWKLNANFGKDDLHAVLHYNDKPQDFWKVIEDKEKFLRVLRSECKKRGIALRYVATTETKRMTNPHHHIILNDMDIHIVTAAWEKVTGGAGHASFKPLDGRGNHADLAAYLMKESKSTQKRLAEGGKNKKRFSCSTGLTMPVPKYEIIPSESWRKEPKAKKGYELYKFKDGETCRMGFHEVSGYMYLEYWEVERPRPPERRRAS